MSRRRAATVVVGITILLSVLPQGIPPALAFTEGTSNNFFGTGAGNAGGTDGAGISNSFFGGSAGDLTSGHFNSFFGEDAGIANTTGGDNAFFGEDAGMDNTTGSSHAFFGEDAGTNNIATCCNSFFGQDAGEFNTTGANNSFFGEDSGLFNTTGDNNAFFGQESGRNNTTGTNNSFFGEDAGSSNTTGFGNSFFGNNAGVFNTTACCNAFFGASAGGNNTTGVHNAFFGHDSGGSNTVEDGNTFLGSAAEGVAGITNATAVGHQAEVSQSNSLVLGSINGLNLASADADVGIGTPAPAQALHVRRTDGTAELLVEESSATTAGRTLFELTNNGAPRFFFNDTSAGGVDWQFSKLSNHNFTISDLGDGGPELVLRPNGTVQIGDAGSSKLALDTSGNLTIAGTLTESSDRAKKTDVAGLNTSKLMSALRQLEISTWRYRGDDKLHLGPMAQDFHRLFGVGTSTTISPRDLAALAVVAAQALDEQNEAQQREIDELKAVRRG